MSILSDQKMMDLTRGLSRAEGDHAIAEAAYRETLKEIKKDIKHLGYATVAKELGISLQLVRTDMQREIGEWLDDKAMLIIESHLREGSEGWLDNGEGFTEMLGNIRFGLAESLIAHSKPKDDKKGE